MPLWTHRLLLGLFLVAVITLQTRFTWDTLRLLSDAQQSLSQPGNVDPDTLAFDTIRDFAKRAGLKDGDKLVSIDGIRIHSRREAFRAFFRQRPGEAMTITVSRSGGPPIDLKVPIPVRSPYDPLQKTVTVFLNIITPWLCILLATLVAYRRAGSAVAYPFILLLLATGKMLDGAPFLRWGWEPWLTWPMVFLENCILALPAAWMWFTLLFPDPHSRHKLFPWAMWVLGVPCFILTLLYAIQASASAHVPGALPWLKRVLDFPATAVLGCVAAMMLLGFANFIYKLMREERPVMRRRLQWMLFGLAIGLAPITLMILWQYAGGVPINSMPMWIQVPGIISPIFLPITLAYAVLIDRVFDVGVFVRHGLLASKSVSFIRLALIGLLVWAAFVLASHTDMPAERRFGGIAACLMGAVVVSRGSEWLRKWVDRRFFQEAVNSEHLLVELSDEVRAINDPQTLLSTVTGRIADALHVPLVLALAPEGGSFVSSYLTPRMELSAAGETVRQLRTYRKPVIATNHPEMSKIGAEVLLPLATNQELLGILSLGPKRSEEPYSRSDLRLLESVASQTALALENGRLTAAVAIEAAHRERIASELEIAREVQQRLFPKAAPAVPGLDLAGACRPAQTIGGDYYDFLAVPSGDTGLAIGDVAGKGIPAALLMAALQASLRGLTLAGIADLGDLMTKLNRLIYDASPANRFATFFYGLYDPATRRLRYSSAGHNPTLLWRSGSGETLWLRTRGVGLGLTRASKYEQAEVLLQPGDCVVLYTDGITEARNPAGDEYGDDRLESAVRMCGTLSATEVLEYLLADVMAFVADAPQHDDITSIVARVM